MNFLLFLLLIIIFLIYFYKPKYNPEYKIIYKNPKYKPTNFMIVAHPDDEILWGFNYLKNKPYLWKVICLTCATNKTRVKEFETTMKNLGIQNYEIWDHDNSIFAKKLNNQALNDITN